MLTHSVWSSIFLNKTAGVATFVYFFLFNRKLHVSDVAFYGINDLFLYIFCYLQIVILILITIVDLVSVHLSAMMKSISSKKSFLWVSGCLLSASRSCRQCSLSNRLQFTAETNTDPSIIVLLCQWPAFAYSFPKCHFIRLTIDSSFSSPL